MARVFIFYNGEYEICLNFKLIIYIIIRNLSPHLSFLISATTLNF